MDRETIYFYDKPSDKVKEEHIFLNNFAYSPFVLDGLEYKTVEHFYQANKFVGSQFEAIRITETPDEAKRLAHSYEYDESEWDKRKDEVMMRALKAKFEQHSELKEQLLNTGNLKLVEDSQRDLYWGGSMEGSQNRLGQMLEELRSNYRKTN
ncbi:hypothetical protein SteCoe_17691 [Stentor coeruleus]|uniref:NADAR domain-containing protein n=1 Tax=Stentor coeruleus TaxID=5963 RepID=A0A1R2BY57_9CILI|nr:hypothetical protein SteCoe_17691 [Stentor coeruleus]